MTVVARVGIIFLKLVVFLGRQKNSFKKGSPLTVYTYIMFHR